MLDVEKIKHRESGVYRRTNLHSSCIHHSSRPRYPYTMLYNRKEEEEEEEEDEKEFKGIIPR